MVKRFATYASLLTLIFQFLGESADAQPVSDSLLLNSPIYREKLHLFSDRSLYASGEIIHFSLQNLSPDLLKNTNWSTVVYLELISNHKIPMAQGKYHMDSTGTMGDLLIPDTIPSGSYHLRAYTKWMRNFEASDYFHLPLTVVNPQKRYMPREPEMDTLQIFIPNPSNFYGGISCSLGRVSFGKREKVTLHINMEERASMNAGYCVSVVKKGYLDLDEKHHPPEHIEKQIHTGEVLYHPETRGMFISGMMKKKNDNTPVAYGSVHITLLGQKSDYFRAVTNKFGRIQFSLPTLPDPAELLITSGSNHGESMNLILHDEFSQDFATPSMTSRNISSIHQNLINEMGIYSQVAKPFIAERGDSLSRKETGSMYSFYGTPEFRYYTADYIEIPNLEEFIIELVPKVQVKKQNSQRYFSVLDDAGPISEFAPLILVDFVPISHVETILSLAPDQIEYMDVVNAIYIRGSTNYGGIISIISKNGDLAGIKLPEGSSIFTFNPIHEKEEVNYPDYNPQEVSKRVPDLRTTLYWSARNEFMPESQHSIEFFTSDVSGEFIAVIRGLSEEGKIVQGFCEFTVK